MGEMPLIRTTLLVALIVAFGLAAAGRSPAADQGQQVIQVAASDVGSRFVPLGIGKSVVIDLPRDVKDVLVADPKIANAVIRSARRAYIIGSTVGQTNVFFFDHNGQQIIGLDIAVTRDLNGLRAAIRQALPNLDIRVEGLGEGVVLSGNVTSPIDAQTALRYRVAPGGRRPQGRERHHRSGPRSGHAEGHRRRDTARRHQAARHRSLGLDRIRHVGSDLQQHQSVFGPRSAAGRDQQHHRALQFRQRDRCAPWSAPASSARWPSRT